MREETVLLICGIILLFGVVKGCLFFIELNKKPDICDRYANLKYRRWLKKEIFNKLVDGDYYTNHLAWYHFEIEGVLHRFGILELLGIFGDDLFRKVDHEKRKRKRIKNTPKIQSNGLS